MRVEGPPPVPPSLGGGKPAYSDEAINVFIHHVQDFLNHQPPYFDDQGQCSREGVNVLFNFYQTYHTNNPGDWDVFSDLDQTGKDAMDESWTTLGGEISYNREEVQTVLDDFKTAYGHLTGHTSPEYDRHQYGT